MDSFLFEHVIGILDRSDPLSRRRLVESAQPGALAATADDLTTVETPGRPNLY